MVSVVTKNNCKTKEPSDLTVPQQGSGLAPQGLPIKQERQAAQDHEDDSRVINKRFVEMTDGTIRCGKAARGNGGHGMGDRFERGHARHRITDGTNDRKADIDQSDRTDDLNRAGQDLFGSFRRFQTEQLHTAHLQHGQNGNGHHNDTDAA